MTKILIAVPLLFLLGCSTTRIERVDSDGVKVVMTDNTFLTKRINQDISALTESDSGFLTEWKLGSSRGDVDMVNAMSAVFAAGMRAAADGAAPGP